MQDLEKLIIKYGININFLYSLKEDQIECLELDEVDKILNFLIQNKVSIKTIEKCPSILLGNFNNVKNNYEYLIKENFNKSKLNSCIHILIENNKELIEKVRYLKDNYEESLINKKLSVLSKDINYIKYQENILRKYNVNDDLLLSIIMDANSSIDYDQIFKLCEKYNVEVNSKMFRHSVNNLKEKLELSKELNIKFSSYMLNTSNENIEKIVEYVKTNNLEFSDIMYSNDIDDLKDIFNILI